MFGLTKKVTVSDIKQHLVNEFKRSNDLETENFNLKDKIKSCVETQVKYDTALVTLNEYENRLKDKDKRIEKLDSDIDELNKKIKQINDEKNTEIIKYKTLENRFKDVSVNAIKDYKKIIISKVSNLKGNISKKQIIDLLTKE